MTSRANAASASESGIKSMYIAIVVVTTAAADERRQTQHQNVLNSHD